MGSGLPHLATVAISRAPRGAFFSYLSFPLVPWRGVLSRAGDKAGGRRLLPRLTPGGRNQCSLPAKTSFQEPALPPLLPPGSPDENATGEKEGVLGDNETVNKISNARIGNDYFTSSDS